MDILSKIPAMLDSTNGAVMSPFRTKIDKATKGFMQLNCSTIDRMAVGFDYSSLFDDFANSLKNPTSVGDFINLVRKENVLVADYLERVVKSFNVDRSETNIVELVWAANIANALGDKDERMENYLSDLLFSLRMSPAYKNVSPMELRGNICHMFEAEINEDRAEDLLEVDADQAQTYLGVAFTENPQTKRIDAWFDYQTFEEIKLGALPSITNLSELKSALASGNVESYAAAYDYIKENFLNATDPKHPGYCENELVKDYKATVIIATMVNKMGLNILDEGNTIGFNLLTKIKNIPLALEQENPLLAISSEINQMEKEAKMVAFKEVLETDKEDPTLDEKQKVDLTKELKELQGDMTGIVAEENNIDLDQEIGNATEKVLGSQDYIKKQLSTYHNFINKKLIDLTNTLKTLVKFRGRKSSFPKAEEKLAEIAEEFSVELITPDQQKHTKTRFYANVDAVIDAVNERFDDLTRSKVIFTKLRKKMGTNLDVENLDFNKELLGTFEHVVTPYAEKIIKDFYRVIKADPKLKTNARYRQKTPIMLMATMQERVKADPDTTPEIAALFRALKLDASQVVKYNEDKILDNEFDAKYNSDDGDIEDEILHEIESV